jgi:hypothetical protein
MAENISHGNNAHGNTAHGNGAGLTGAQPAPTRHDAIIHPPHDRISFSIAKSFGRLLLIPEPVGLRLRYIPNVNGELAPDALGFCEVIVPLEAVGGLWATARAFLYGVESLDENVIIQMPDGVVLIKLYRDKPKGAQGNLSGQEISWLRIVTGTTEEERRRIKLGPRDLLSLELSCNAVLTLSGSTAYRATDPRQNGTVRTKPVGAGPGTATPGPRPDQLTHQ